MNTDPHLDLGDLVAEVTGQPVGDRARAHLAACEHCQLEANRWNLVVDGVRGLAAAAPAAAAPETAAPETAALETAAPEAAQPGRPGRTGQRVVSVPWRRAMVVAGSVAA